MSSPESDASLSSSSSNKRTATDDDNMTATNRQKKTKFSDALQEYRTAGRKAVAVLSPFANASLAFHHGMMLDKSGISDSNLSQEQQTRFLMFYNGILDFIPGFRASLDDLSYENLKPYITAINSSMSSQRSDDFSSLKYSMLEYIIANHRSDTLQPPIPKSSCKSTRGVNHPRLARELCPQKWLHQFDEDVNSGMLRLQDGTWPLIATNWPSFLYPAGASYDEEDPNIGLFRGHAGIRAFQHIYLGPTAAGLQDNEDQDGKHGGGKSKSTMYGLTKVTPQSWAWAMCVAWFSLCSCNSYRLTIGSFNLEEFFFAIVETLSDPEDPWAVETLAWIDEQVFGKHATKATMVASNDATSDLAKMQAKRAARKQAATSTPATGNTVGNTITSAPPRLPPVNSPTCKQAASSASGTASAAVSTTTAPSRPPLLATPPRQPSLTPSSPLSLTSSPILPPFLKRGNNAPPKLAEPAAPEPATAPPDHAPTAVPKPVSARPKPLPVLRTQRVPKPKPKPVPAKSTQSARGSARLAANNTQVEGLGNGTMEAPAVLQKRQSVPRRGRKAA